MALAMTTLSARNVRVPVLRPLAFKSEDSMLGKRPLSNGPFVNAPDSSKSVTSSRMWCASGLCECARSRNGTLMPETRRPAQVSARVVSS